jgi:hypothetical protein
MSTTLHSVSVSDFSNILHALAPFKGGSDELFLKLCQRKDFCSLANAPAEREFLSTLRAMAPEMAAQGVVVTISDGLHGSGLRDLAMVRIQTTTAAAGETSAEDSLRTGFFSDTAEAAAIRREFNNDFETWAAYKRGVLAGRIHPPRVGRNVIDREDKGAHAQVDPRLTVEAQCRQRWELEPEVRRQHGDYRSFEAFERAKARGQVRNFGGGI